MVDQYFEFLKGESSSIKSNITKVESTEPEGDNFTKIESTKLKKMDQQSLKLMSFRMRKE